METLNELKEMYRKKLKSFKEFDTLDEDSDFQKFDECLEELLKIEGLLIELLKKCLSDNLDIKFLKTIEGIHRSRKEMLYLINKISN